MFLTIIGTASAGEHDLIAAVDSSEKIIPFSQTLDACLNKNIPEYNASINKNNLNNILGNDVNSLYPSYSFLQQVSSASRVNLPDLVFSPTKSLLKYEVAYISEKYLTQDELKTLLLKFQSPIISKNTKNFWNVTTSCAGQDLISFLLEPNNQNALNNYLTDSKIFQQSGSNLLVLRLGDITGFNSNNLNVVHAEEFKTSLTPITPDTINSTFATRFKKSLLVDNQLFDSINNTLHHKSCGSSVIESSQVNSLQINDADLTKKFTLGHKLATNIHNQPLLKFNLVSFTLNNISKIIK